MELTERERDEVNKARDYFRFMNDHDPDLVANAYAGLQMDEPSNKQKKALRLVKKDMKQFVIAPLKGVNHIAVFKFVQSLPGPLQVLVKEVMPSAMFFKYVEDSDTIRSGRGLERGSGRKRRKEAAATTPTPPPPPPRKKTSRSRSKPRPSRARTAGAAAGAAGGPTNLAIRCAIMRTPSVMSSLKVSVSGLEKLNKTVLLKIMHDNPEVRKNMP